MRTKQPIKPENQAVTPGAFDKKGAASYLSVSTRTVDLLVKAGRLKKKKLGAKSLFLRKDLDSFLQSL